MTLSPTLRSELARRLRSIDFRYHEVTGRHIDPSNGYAQVTGFNLLRPDHWSCSQMENAQRIYGEYSSISDLLEGY